MGRYNRQERRIELDSDAELQLWARKLGVSPHEVLGDHGFEHIIRYLDTQREREFAANIDPHGILKLDQLVKVEGRWYVGNLPGTG